MEAHNADSVPAVPLQISMNDTSLPKHPLPEPPQESGKLPVAQTMVSAKSKPGDAQVTVQHAMGFAAGMPLTISPGPAQISGDRVPPVHNNTIVGVNFNVIYLAAPLPHAITVGSIVMGFPSKAATSAGSDIIGPSVSVNESTCANTSARATLGGTALASKVTGESVEGSEETKESLVGNVDSANHMKMKPETKDEVGDQGSIKKTVQENLESSRKPTLVPVPPMDSSSSRSITGSLLTAEARDNEEDVAEHRRGLAAIADSNIYELLKPGTHPHTVFNKAMLRRLDRENEARDREESVYADMENVELIVEHQRAESLAKNGPMSLAKLVRTALFFKGYNMVVDPLPEVVAVTGNTTPLMNGEFAENIVVSVYKQYTNESGFMSVEELVRFFSDSGIVNTHCPHTPFDEPVVEVAEQLDPVRMLATMPMADTQGVNNPQENNASKALQETLKRDQFAINFTQFFGILQKVSRVVYPAL